MDWQINGLPLHILILHVTVVAVPAAALLVILAAVWPAARKRLGWATPLMALISLASVLLAIQAGEWLEERVTETALTEIHTEHGEMVEPWAIGLFFVAVVQWVWFRYFVDTNLITKAPAKYADRVTSKAVRVAVVAVLAVAIAATSVGSVVTVIIVGESGATAVWNDRLTTVNPSGESD
jgi:hypothetical protein